MIVWKFIYGSSPAKVMFFSFIKSKAVVLDIYALSTALGKGLEVANGLQPQTSVCSSLQTLLKLGETYFLQPPQNNLKSISTDQHIPQRLARIQLWNNHIVPLENTEYTSEN